MAIILYINNFRGAAPISTSPILQGDAPLITSDLTLLRPDEIEHKKKMKGYIIVDGPVSYLI